MIYGCLLFAIVLLSLLLSQNQRRLFRAWLRQGEDSIRLETASRPCETGSKFPDLLQQYLQQVLPRVRIAGLWTVADASGPAVSKGEVLRYMAELPWAPWGFLQLERAYWEELLPNELALSLTVGNQQARLIYRFDAQGLIESIRARNRLAAGNKAIPVFPGIRAGL